MNRITTGKALWMLAATIVVVTILVELQSGGMAEEAISARVPRGGFVPAESHQVKLVVRPSSESGEQGVRRLPPVAPAPLRVATPGRPKHQSLQRYTPYGNLLRANTSERVSQASWDDQSADHPRGPRSASTANDTLAGRANLPRTADDGHVYENDLPAPKQSEPVSLHLSEVSVRQALEMLSRSHGINMLVGPTVSGTVTANLEGLDSDTALNAILKLCNLIAHRENGLIYIYAATEYPAIDFQVQTFALDYVDATDLLPIIQSLLSATGQTFATQIDPLDNTKSREAIAVIDMPRVIQRAAEYIRQVDIPPLQVMIEAHVLQVALNEDCRHGINYNQVMQAAGNGGIALDVVGFADPASSPSVFAHLTTRHIDGLLEFLKETTDSKTLASPRVMVINGQTAKIQVGEQIPYTVVTVTETSAIEEVRFLDVGVVLEVTPRITKDGRVMMRVKPKVSEGTFAPGSDLPGEETREVQSDVLIRDGEGVVIGGLIQEKDSDVQIKVPYLGDLHYIGRLFQRRQRIKLRSEVVITLIPRIQYPDGYDQRDVIDLERSQTPLLHGPLDPVYRPWEASLPDAVDNPLTLRQIRQEFPRINRRRCRSCQHSPYECEHQGDSLGPEKPLLPEPGPTSGPAAPLRPALPGDAGPNDSLMPSPVTVESARFVAPGEYRYTTQASASPPAVLIQP